MTAHPPLVSPVARPAAWGAVAGLVAAYLDFRLVVGARGTCDAGMEAGGRFELTAHLVTRALLMPVVTVVSVVAGAIALRASRRTGAPETLCFVLGAAVALAGPVALGLYDFAVVGTLDGYPGDSGVCGPDNVPPWWPSWLPS